jgi:hypothetical protein
MPARSSGSAAHGGGAGGSGAVSLGLRVGGEFEVRHGGRLPGECRAGRDHPRWHAFFPPTIKKLTLCLTFGQFFIASRRVALLCFRYPA